MKTKLLIELGHEIKKMRQDKGLTQEELGLRLNVSRASIAGYEIGDREIGWNNFLKLCDICGAKPSEVIDRLEKYAYR